MLYVAERVCFSVCVMYNPVCLSVFSGIGFALCDRLLHEDAQIELCLACRNMQRAEDARSALLVSHPQAQVSLLHLDVGNMRSVVRAAEEFKKK